MHEVENKLSNKLYDLKELLKLSILTFYNFSISHFVLEVFRVMLHKTIFNDVFNANKLTQKVNTCQPLVQAYLH